MCGWALRAFAEEGGKHADSIGIGGSGQVPLDHPLYEWRSIASSIRQIAVENGLGRFGVGYAGSCLVSTIESLIANDVIRPGDDVVIEDAGNHGGDPPRYGEAMLQWRRAVVDNVAAICIMMTMFDYEPFHGRMPDAEFDRGYAIRGGRTISANEAIRQAASAVYWTGPEPQGQTVLIDMNQKMDLWRTRSLSAYGVDPMHPDGVHPNCWGQWLLVREILCAISGADLRALEIVSILELARANWRALGYRTKSPFWSPSNAEACMRQLLGDT